MKRTILVLAFIIAIVVLGFAATALSDSNTVTVVNAEPIPSQLTHQQTAWLGALELCESGGDPAAINPRDSDGTPSYGILQFKPGTYAEFAKLYGLASTTDYMNATEQEQIVTQMIVRGGVDFHQQFPACTHRLGIPPRY